MSGELITQEQAVPVVLSEGVAFVQMLERASRDPAVDVDKLERLMVIRERMLKTQAESDFNDALVACQRECGPISADATNPQTRSKYATYAKLDRVLRPIYTKHGISISYSTGETAKPDTVLVLAYVARGGHTRMYRVDMPADGKGAKGGDVMTKTHATGAAMSYGSRYLLKSIFNISIGDEDDDGNIGHRGLDPVEKKRFMDTIDLCETIAQTDTLWAEIAEATTKAGDVPANDELRLAMAAKRKALKVPK